MRAVIIAATAITSCLLAAEPALAAEKNIGFKPESEIAKLCDEKGGTLWSQADGSSYGCGYNGGGGIMCDEGGKDANGNAVPASCTEITREAERDDRWGLAGLVGLLGLLGLSGLRGTKRRPNADNGRAP